MKRRTTRAFAIQLQLDNGEWGELAAAVGKRPALVVAESWRAFDRSKRVRVVELAK